jgi:hypothetical protein
MSRRVVPEPGLTWGIKLSFLQYIGRMPDGQGMVWRGAHPTETGEMVFEPDLEGSPRLGGAVHSLPFRGDVRFAGHHGMLYVRIADPLVVIEGGGGELSILDPWSAGAEPRLTLVNLANTTHARIDGFDVWTSKDVRLSSQATALFNDAYPAGEPFETLTIAWPDGEACGPTDS